MMVIRKAFVAQTHKPEAQARRGSKGGKLSKGGGRPSLGQPWVDMGISRATYFNRKKAGLL